MEVLEPNLEQKANSEVIRYYGYISLTSLERYLDNRHEAQLLNELTLVACTN